VDSTVVGASTEKLKKLMSQVALVARKEKSVQLEIAPGKKTANYAIIALHFPATHFCKVINACRNITHFSALAIQKSDQLF